MGEGKAEGNEQLRAIWNQSFDRLASTSKLYDLSKKQQKGASLHKFAIGHIFSMTLAEEIERSTDKVASWGQIIDSRAGLSPEIDVIVYTGRPQAAWPKAGYVLVKSEQVVATVNCKVELMTNVTEMRKFGESLRLLKSQLPKTALNFVFAEYTYRKRDTLEIQKTGFLNQGWTAVYVLFDGSDGEDERRGDWYSFMDRISGMR